MVSTASAFRYHDDVPLLVPNVNMSHAALLDVQRKQHGWKGFIVPIPNCTVTGLVIALLNTCTRLKLIWADAGYDGAPLTGWIASVAGITLQVIKRTELHTFRVVPRRWVVERSFGWLLRYRRLVRDYERRPEHHEAMVYWATVLSMTRRLARRQSDPPVVQRWGQPRPRPSTLDPLPA